MRRRLRLPLGRESLRELPTEVTALAAVIALAVGVVLPAAYFLSNYATMHAEIAAEGKLAAAAISRLASSNPEL